MNMWEIQVWEIQLCCELAPIPNGWNFKRTPTVCIRYFVSMDVIQGGCCHLIKLAVPVLLPTASTLSWQSLSALWILWRGYRWADMPNVGQEYRAPKTDGRCFHWRAGCGAVIQISGCPPRKNETAMWVITHQPLGWMIVVKILIMIILNNFKIPIIKHNYSQI